MKDAIIVALLLPVALLSLGQSRDPQPAIQDTMLHHADFPVCVTVPTEPIQPPKRADNLYPRRSDAA